MWWTTRRREKRRKESRARSDEGVRGGETGRDIECGRKRDGPRVAGASRRQGGEKGNMRDGEAMEGLAGIGEGGERGAAVGQLLSRQAPASG